MMAHRLLEHYLNGGKSVSVEEYEEKCEHSSEMEKLAAEAERASIKYKQVQFLIDKVGEEYDGTISGVTEWGIFVEIVENKCEGLVRAREMNDDSYTYDEDNYRYVGRHKGKVYALGDTVFVIVKKADLLKKQLDFGFMDSDVEKIDGGSKQKHERKKYNQEKQNSHGKQNKSNKKKKRRR